ncbi:hypothetical protein [Natronoglycomyces albus]|uniref:Uncharacterized protein n=1 Tax=Natronoglycomyces albus TaxID=2811108 RepID=A0A895XQ12_9ACTN|nr:hypothetical protein [Natronoglycomyces albus]QSB05459.1 hypothetical protein JQS30_00495 [Natronoglycomyces albus]
MSRTVGPFTDVATARVEGAYEICEGMDTAGRSVQILTLGITSAKDPGRRALLSDTVAWAHATAGPGDAPILQADLTSDQPYVVTLQSPQMHGAERILDRLLELGPPTGPIPLVSTQRSGNAPHHESAASTTGSQPAVPHSMSPFGPNGSTPSHHSSGITRKPKKPPRLNALVAILGVLALLVLGGGSWAAWTYLGPDDTANDAAPTDAETNEESTGGTSALEDSFVPEFKPAVEELHLPAGVFEDDEETKTVAEAGWPFAFRIPADFSCSEEGRIFKCSPPSGGNDVTLSWSVCPDGCPDSVQDELHSQMPYGPLDRFNSTIGFSERHPHDVYRASLSFFVPVDEEVIHIKLVADTAQNTAEEVQKIINDVLTQAHAI